MSQRKFEREQARRQATKRRRAGLAAGAASAAVLLAPSAAHAASFQVNTLNDSLGTGTCATADAECTLRDAIAQANANDENDTITFASGLTGTIYLVNGQLEINSGRGLTITGPGITVSGHASAAADTASSRIFSVSGSGDTRISGLTLTGGNGEEGTVPIPPPTGPGDVDQTATPLVAPFGLTGGGAITTDGDLTLSGVTITNNSATASDSSAGGGVLVTGGQTTVDSGSQVTHNIATTNNFLSVASGGGIANVGGALDVRDSEVSHNEAAGFFSQGGGIAAGTSTTVDGASLADNTASGVASYGGAIAGAVDVKYPDGRLQRAAAETAGDLVIRDSTLDGTNSASYGGGVGASFYDDSDSSYAYFHVDNVTVEGTTIADNSASRSGAGVAVSDVQSTNSVKIKDSTVSGNAVTDESSGIGEERQLGELSGTGGGIDVTGVRGSVLVSNSTVAENEAGAGGGIHLGNGNSESAASQLKDPSVGILTARGRMSRAIVEPTGSVKVDNTTVADNTAATIGGGVAVDDEATDGNAPSISSTIVSGNSGDEIDNDVSTAEDTKLVAGYSLIQTPGSATIEPVSGQPNKTGQDPDLGDLGDNGGPTDTLLPALTSPAIDSGVANGLTTDQRGFARTVDRSQANVADGTDIGSVEVPADEVAPPNRTNPPASPSLRPSSVPVVCSRRRISLIDARVKGSKVVLSGLVGPALYGKTVTILTDPKAVKASGYTKTTTVKASSTGEFKASVPRPAKEDFVSVRYRAAVGTTKSVALKLPQSISSRSVKSANGTITVKGRVERSVLGKRNPVKIRRLVCGRYRTVGSARPDAKGNYSVTFKATAIRGVSLYRAEARVLVRPDAKKYAIQYGRAISIKTTGQTG